MESPIRADHVTYHHHSGPETTSEAVQNYAGAAFLVGLAVMSVGAAVGFIMGAKGESAAKMEAAKRESAAKREPAAK